MECEMMVAKSSSSSSFETTAISILVVDDDNTCLTIITALLKKLNYKVVTVKRAREALYTLRIMGGAFDLVVSDVHMPDMNGFELQRIITNEFNLPVVLMSADEKKSIALKGLEGGAVFFLSKPLSQHDLKGLWQFAASRKRRNQNVFIQESRQANTSKGMHVFEEEIAPAVSAAFANEGSAMNKKESKKKNPRIEGSRKPKIVWTISMHQRFLDAINSIDHDKAVPKKILAAMNIPGLTRHNIASHLQKYRIFQRRLSEARMEIQYAPNGLSMSMNYNFHSHGNFNVAAPLQNLGVSSSTHYQQSRLLSNNETRYIPPMGTSTLAPCHPCVKLAPNSYGARASNSGYMVNIGKNHSGIAMSSSFGALPNTSNYGFMFQNTSGSSDIMYQTNYVGCNISNILSLAESVTNNDKCGGSSSSRGVPSFSRAEPQAAMVSNVSHAENFEANNNGQKLLSNVSDYRSMHFGFENGGEIQDSTLSPICDLPEFNMASDQPNHQCSWPNQLTNVPDPLERDFGGEISISSNLFDDAVQWENLLNASYSFDQTQNQQVAEISQLEMTSSQGIDATSQINEIVMEPNYEQLELENIFNSLEIGTFPQIPSPEQSVDINDYLDSTLAPNGDFHLFDGPS